MKKQWVFSLLMFSASLNLAHASDGLEIKGYGFLLPKFLFSSAGATSFSNQAETAPTAAADGSLSQNSSSRSTWQIGQSRLGLKMSYGPQVTGVVEVDFFNQSDASPEYTLLAPRLRLAKINYQASEMVTVIAGQDWDNFNGNVNPYTYNVVGLYYQSGNVGFLRQQLMVKVGETQGINVTAALGMPQKNDDYTTGAPTPDGAAELTMLPTASVNLTYTEDENNLVGIAGIVGRVLFSPTGNVSTNDSRSAGGLSVFGLKDFGKFNLRGKFYYGKNLSNLNAISLTSGAGTGVSVYDLFEYGGFFTLQIPLTEKLGIFGGVGYASVFDSNSIIGTSVVLNSNLKLDLGVEYKLTKNLNTYAEFSSFTSKYNEGSTSNINTYIANMIDVGMKLLL